MSKKKISVITLGCSKNTVDSERLMKQIEQNKFELSDDPNTADTVIINTCGFIEAAKEESISTILEAVKMKSEGKINKVIVAGCLSVRYMEDLKKEIPEVDGFFATEDYENIITSFGGDLKYELLGERVLSAPSHSAYLKISEGCDHPCSFCAIPLMRGKHRTVPKEKLIAEAEFLARSGTKEIILIGQDTTDYGIDLYGERNIASLIRDISAIEGIKWIRLMYAYPSHFPEDLIDEIANNPKVVKYIDIPLQHISDVCLRSMRRGITKRATIDLIEKLRARIPDLTLRTTFILGYPAETKKEFQELCDFVSEYQFDRVGVFPYSQEENTVSYILGDPVGVKEKKRRMDALMEMQMEISARKNQQFVGKSLAVIVDGIEGEYYACRSFQDAPEVDGNVLIPVSDGTLTAGMIVDAFVYESNEYDLFAHFNPNT